MRRKVLNNANFRFIQAIDDQTQISNVFFFFNSTSSVCPEFVLCNIVFVFVWLFVEVQQQSLMLFSLKQKKKTE